MNSAEAGGRPLLVEETLSVKAQKERACYVYGRAETPVWLEAEGMLGTAVGNEVREVMGTRL